MQTDVRILAIESESEGQRLDNFLVKTLKGVPKSRIYKAIRKGEVRINKKRVKAEYKLSAGDELRIPPLRVAEQTSKTVPDKLMLAVEQSIILETNQLVVINKPCGMAVHGGSGVPFGVIEILRAARVKLKFLELVHRLDRQTSGCLVIAKKSMVLKELNNEFKKKSVDKRYLALLLGECDFKRKTVDLPLSYGHLQGSERVVRASTQGKSAVTTFRVLAKLPGCTLVEALPLTGRMHQIRVHALELGHPIVGDEKYGNRSQDKPLLRRYGKRMYLHCASLSFDSESLQHAVAVGAIPDACFMRVFHEI